MEFFGGFCVVVIAFLFVSLAWFLSTNIDWTFDGIRKEFRQDKFQKDDDE